MNKYIPLLGLLLLIFLIGVIGKANSAAPTVTEKITITFPSIGCTVGVSPCDNMPLTGGAALIGSEIFVSTSPIPDIPTAAPTHSLAAGVTVVNSTISVANGGTIYARGRVKTATQVSNLGPQISIKVDLPIIPGAPLLTIETVAYQLNLGSNNNVTLSRVGSIPLGKECLSIISLTDRFRTVSIVKDRNWALMDPNPSKPGEFFTRPRQIWARCGTAT